MTSSNNRCMFHQTLAAKELGLDNSTCEKPITRIIAGGPNATDALEFCEEHFQVVNQWIENKTRKDETGEYKPDKMTKQIDIGYNTYKVLEEIKADEKLDTFDSVIHKCIAAYKSLKLEGKID